jgi:hypothetical protein
MSYRRIPHVELKFGGQSSKSVVDNLQRQNGHRDTLLEWWAFVSLDPGSQLFEEVSWTLMFGEVSGPELIPIESN